MHISFSWRPAGAPIAFAAACLLAMVCALANASAAEPEWPKESYDYVVVDQDLRTVLEQFGINTGLRIVMSDTVQGRVRGRLPPAPPRQFLNHLTEMFGLDWYYDGATISISAKSEAQTEVITLKDATLSELQTALETGGFADRRYQLRPGPDKGSVVASGPPRYLAAVKQLATSLSPASGPTSVKIMRGSSVSRVDFP